MAYTYNLYDTYGNLITHKDLQKQAPWYEQGIRSELIFVSKYGKQFSLDINPEKKFENYAPDLINTATGVIGDLKEQNTPFFRCSKKDNKLNPRYTVSFNVDDYNKYSKYDQFDVYFWVSWKAIKFVDPYLTIEVEPLEGIWRIDLNGLSSLVDIAHKHDYHQRVFDENGNSKDSYLLDLRSKEFVQIV